MASGKSKHKPSSGMVSVSGSRIRKAKRHAKKLAYFTGRKKTLEQKVSDGKELTDSEKNRAVKYKFIERVKPQKTRQTVPAAPVEPPQTPG